MTWTIIVAVTIMLLVIGVSGATTNVGPWYKGLRKPRWNPPDWAFGPAWFVILACTASAGVLGWTRAGAPGEHALIALLFALNIPLQMLWSPLFFNLKRPDWALVEVPFLWLSILALILALASVSALAGLLLLPYLLWVTFAACINLAIVRMNRPFTSAA
jgi:tryptophan-rich sensory protein